MVFCSYSTINQEKIEPIIAFLNENNIGVWIDKSKVSGGDSLFQKIDRGIDNSNFFFAFITKEYLASAWCQEEYEAAHICELESKEKFIIPIVLDDCKPPLLIRKNRIIYLNNDIDKESGFKEILKIVQVSKPNNEISSKEKVNILSSSPVILENQNSKIINVQSCNIDVEELVREISDNKHLSISLQFECKLDASRIVVLNNIKTFLRKLEQKIKIYKVKEIDFCILGISPSEAFFYFELHRTLKDFQPKYDCDLTYRTNLKYNIKKNKPNKTTIIVILSEKNKQDTIQEIKKYLFNNSNSTLTLDIQLENNNDITLVNKLKGILINLDKELKKDYTFFIESNENKIVLSQLEERVKLKYIKIKHKEK